MTNADPFHDGERQVQALAGQALQAEAVGRMVANRITPAAREFLAAQSMLLVGSWDGARSTWPSLLFGTPGFVSSQDGETVCIRVDAAGAAPADPLWDNLHTNGLIGLLAIDLATRRRLRINGHLRTGGTAPAGYGEIQVCVDEVYPNCPKYIQRRRLRGERSEPASRDVRRSAHLSDEQQQLIARADTCFVASVQPQAGADISHRGGPPGFVHVESGQRLRIPDYAGNALFNTLGNIQASGIAGLLVIDFAGQRQLQVIGDAEIDWTPRSVAVERSWILAVKTVCESQLPAGLGWEFIDYSPFNPGT
jgi:predicted pyridoxine 5'-phosphate oxidase superfamily flavin-nucleotide-binding protein